METQVSHRFAKLFDLDQHQVLVKKKFNSDEDAPHELTIETRNEGISISFGLSFVEAQERDEAFTLYSLQDANKHLGVMLKMFKPGKEEQR